MPVPLVGPEDQCARSATAPDEHGHWWRVFANATVAEQRETGEAHVSERGGAS